MLRFIAHYTNEVNKELLFWEVDTTKPWQHFKQYSLDEKKTTRDKYGKWNRDAWPQIIKFTLNK